MIDAEQYARNARVLGKVFTGVDWAIDGADLVNAAIEGFLYRQLESVPQPARSARVVDRRRVYALRYRRRFTRRRWCRRRWAFSPRLPVWLGHQLYRCGPCRRTGKIHPRDVNKLHDRRGGMPPLLWGMNAP